VAASMGPILHTEPPCGIWLDWISGSLPCLPAQMRFGAAKTRWAAWIAARDNKGVVAPGDEALSVAGVFLDDIELPAEVRRKLRWLGLKQLKDIAALPEGALTELLGEDGLRLEILSRGGDPEAPTNGACDAEIIVTIELDGCDEGGVSCWPMLQDAIGRIFDQLKARSETFKTLKLTLETAQRAQKTVYVRWSALPSDKKRLLSAVFERLQRETYAFLPERISIQPLDIVQQRSQQMSWQQAPKQSFRHITELERRGLIHGVMKAVVDDLNAATPDEVAHLEGLSNSDIRRPLCLPKQACVVAVSQQHALELRTKSGSHPINSIHARWEVKMRWWSPNPLWRQYYIALAGQLGPVRLFRDPHTRQWFRH